MLESKEEAYPSTHPPTHSTHSTRRPFGSPFSGWPRAAGSCLGPRKNGPCTPSFSLPLPAAEEEEVEEEEACRCWRRRTFSMASSRRAGWAAWPGHESAQRKYNLSINKRRMGPLHRCSCLLLAFVSCLFLLPPPHKTHDPPGPVVACLSWVAKTGLNELRICFLHVGRGRVLKDPDTQTVLGGALSPQLHGR